MEPLGTQDPTRLGEYRLVGRLGRGGMGRVYAAEDSSGRLVAVKVVHEALASDPHFMERFRREVQAAQRVDGRHTARVLGADVDAPRPWMAVEYVEGPTLEEAVLGGGPLPPARVYELADGIAAALVDIHSAGVVHRDLKPTNVMLSSSGPRVIDFGIARATDATSLTMTGVATGSAGYMSPEQATSAQAGEAGDVFALGAILYFAATGRHAFGTGSAPAVMYRVVHEQPDLSAVPGDELRSLVAACLQKDPAARPTPWQLCRHELPIVAATDAVPSPPVDLLDQALTIATHRVVPPPPSDGGSQVHPALSGGGSRTALMVGALVVVLAVVAVGVWLMTRGAGVVPSPEISAASASAPGGSRPTSASPAPSSPSAEPSVTGPTAVGPTGQPPVTTSPPSPPVTTHQVTGAPTPRPSSPAPPTPTPSTPTPSPRARVQDGPGCFATAVQGAFTLGAGQQHVAGGPNFTSPACQGIHLKLTGALYRTYARACLELPDGSAITRCGDWVFLSYPDTWDTLLTSVPPSSRWQLQMYGLDAESVRFQYTA